MANADLQLNACPRAIAKVRKERDLLPSHTIKKTHPPTNAQETNKCQQTASNHTLEHKNR